MTALIPRIVPPATFAMPPNPANPAVYPNYGEGQNKGEWHQGLIDRRPGPDDVWRLGLTKLRMKNRDPGFYPGVPISRRPVGYL